MGYPIRGNRAARSTRSTSQPDSRGEQLRQRRLRATRTDITGARTELELDVLQTVIREGGCRAVIDGEQGAGQFETHWQGSHLDYLSTRDT
jgi:hypothetical protein